MSQTTLVASIGRETGSPAARRLRTEGKIPGVLYGHGMTPISLSVERRELRLAVSGAGGFNTLIQLEINGTKYPAIIKDMQRHPIRRNVSHIDFLQVSMSEEVTINVPLRLEGEAKAVVSEDGLVDPSVDSIEVVCTPGNMPAEVVVDITNMQLGDVIRLADVAFPKGVTATGDPDMVIVTTMRSAQGSADAADAAAPAATTEGTDAAE